MNSDQQVMEIEVRGLGKSYGELEVLDGVDFEVHTDEVVGLIGPSGSGKSTLLRCLNLLEVPDSGTITWEGQAVDYANMTPAEMAAHRTHMGMVFQHFHLFPHLTVLQNITAGPVHVLGRPLAEAEEQAHDLLRSVGLEEKTGAWPGQLSGGQKQRVAIARALAMGPRVLLLDEVTSALDVEMISGINELLAGLAAGGMTMVVVTHDLAFARSVADRVCFLDEGKVLEVGSPDQILEAPRHPRVREFLATLVPTAAGAGF